MKLRIGVLALQGSFSLHKNHLLSLNSEYCEVRSVEELCQIDGLIIPGGESTTILKCIIESGLKEKIKDFAGRKPTWGICAGAILLAKTVTNPKQESLGVLDIEISRNSYGRQMESFEEVIGEEKVSFIRAPIIRSTGSKVRVCHRRNNYPVWVEQNFVMATSFHPELNHSFPSSFHRYFINKVCAR